MSCSRRSCCNDPDSFCYICGEYIFKEHKRSITVADPENFGGGDFKHKTSKILMSSPKLRVIFRPKSEIQTFFSPEIRWSPKKKKKKVFTKIESDFLAGFVTFRLVGGDASRNGLELFEIEADFSAKIVTFRLVGGMHPPHPPPLNPPLVYNRFCSQSIPCILWS